MADSYQLTWDLDSIFEGGSGSPALLSLLDNLESAPGTLRQQIEALPVPETSQALDLWKEALNARDQLRPQLSQAGSFIGCLVSQDVTDTSARLLEARAQQLVASFESVDLLLKDRIRHVPKPVWRKLLADDRFQPVSFQLQEMRDRAAEYLPPVQESLVLDLAVDGHHAWERLYYTVVGRMQVPWEENGTVQQLSVGQASNKFSHPDPTVRARLFDRWSGTWARESELIAEALNHSGGFRLATFRHRGWDSVLARGLVENRMTEATLTAMWDAVSAGKGDLVAYLRRKAELLGLDNIHWYDEQASISGAERKVGYDEAAGFIVEQFGRFSPRMAGFAERAFENRWIEAEDRPGKDPGGYCTRLPLSRESRIFTTFGGTSSGVATLAHELGHAYHNDTQWDLPPMARGSTMCTAETASTFAETLITKASLAQAGSDQERLAILDESLRQAVTMFMNIHARFLFEQRFYEERAKGLLSVEELNRMMLEAQKEAYMGSLAAYHPYFWAEKRHFYITELPFYNFPYTFGYLFGAGIYARAVADGEGFEEQYRNLLRDTGRMTTEDLAARHLGVDLMKPDFWMNAVKLVTEDAREFLRLS